MKLSEFGLSRKEAIKRTILSISATSALPIYFGSIEPFHVLIVGLIVSFVAYKQMQYEGWGQAAWDELKSYKQTVGKKKREDQENASNVECFLVPLSSLPPEKIMTLKEALPYLGIAPQTFYNNPDYQRGFKKRGKSWVITNQNLRSMLEK